MSDRRFALRSTRVLTPDGEAPGVVVVADGYIVEVLDPGDEPPGTEDLGDLAILPGFVDSHVHINDPGRADWEGFESATLAAAVAGITTLVDMPLNSLPSTTSHDALMEKVEAARGRLHVNVAFWGGIVPGSEDAIEELYQAGVLGFKVFTCESGVPEYGAFAPDDIAALLARTGPLGVPLIVHAEDPRTLAGATPGPDADPRAYRTWLDSRPPEAEDRAVTALLDALRSTPGRLHVLHLSAASALELIENGRREDLQVTVETCPHYLTLAAEDVIDGATEFKCAPPIRDGGNQEALWEGLASGSIDAVVSDHSPSPPAAKHLDDGDMLAAWGGIASLQLGPGLVWSAARRRGFGLGELVRWMSAGPARVAGLRHKGAITPGAHADLVVFDPDATWIVEAAALHHRHPVTPYEGRVLAGVTRRTYLGGRLIVQDGELVLPGAGRPRPRDKV